MSLKKVSAFILHAQTLLFIPIMLFLFYTVTAFYGYTKDLIPNTGTITFLDTVSINSPKAIRSGTDGCYIRLGLDIQSDHLFQIIYSPRRYFILTRLNREHEVTVFTEPQLFESDQPKIRRIVKLVSGGNVVIDHSDFSRRVDLTLFLVFLPLFLAFLLLYFFLARNRFKAVMLS